MSALKIKVFADGADFDQMLQLAKNPNVKGFTTNPTLMRKAGVSDYAEFARKVLDAIPDRPIYSKSSPTTWRECSPRGVRSPRGDEMQTSRFQ